MRTKLTSFGKHLEKSIRRGNLQACTRYYGKGEMVSHMGEQPIARQACEARGGGVFYVNAEAYNNLPKLTARLFATATESLIRFPLKAKTTIREALSRFKSTLSVDTLMNKVTGSLSFDAAAREQPVPLLVEALNLIEQLASEQKKPVSIIIDEFQAIILEGGEKAEGQIRAAIQDHTRVG